MTTCPCDNSRGLLYMTLNYLISTVAWYTQREREIKTQSSQSIKGQNRSPCRCAWHLSGHASISSAASSASLSSCIRSASRYAQTLGHHYRPSPICNGSRATKVFLNHIQAISYIAAVLCARLAATHASVLTHVPVQLAWCSGLSWPPQTPRSPPPASGCAGRFSR